MRHRATRVNSKCALGDSSFISHRGFGPDLIYDETMLRDHYKRVPISDALAAERTLLAAERTLLAYVRTAFAMVVVGLSGSQFLEDRLLVTLGYFFSFLSAVVLAVGVLRFVQSRRATLRVLERPPLKPT